MRHNNGIGPIGRERPATGRKLRPGLWLVGAVVVLLIAAALRLIALHDVPPGLSQDEVLNADIVQFIRGGEHAFFFPYGFGHEPLYHYFSVPFQWLLGDNVLSIRLPAATLGLLLVALALRWARRDYGDVVGLATGAGLAVSWWAIIFSRVGIRPIMEPVLLVGAALLWPFGASKLTRRVWLRGLTAGMLLGLALYTYTAARVMFALPVAHLLYAVVMVWWSSRGAGNGAGRFSEADAARFRTQTWLAAVALLVMGVIYLPLLATLRSQPELQQRVEQLAGPLTALQAGDPIPVLQATLRTLGYVGLMGDPRWTYGLPDVPLFGPLMALLFIGGLLLAFSRWRRPATAYALLWLLVAAIPSAITPDSPSSVRLVGALPVVFLMPALMVGYLDGWVGRRRSTAAWLRPALTVTVLIVFAVYAARSVRNGFSVWPAELETRLRYQTAWRDVARLLPEVDTSAEGVPLIADSFVEPIDDASVQRNLAIPRETRWIQSGPDVAGALLWPASELAGASTDGVWLLVPEFAPLSPSLLAKGGLAAEPIRRTGERPSVALYQLNQIPPDHRVGVGRAFVSGQGEKGSELVELRGYDMLDDATLLDGRQALELLTSWQVLDETPDDLALFVHLLDEGGQLVAQHDGLDASAYFLQPGDRFWQRHLIGLPAELAPGDYRLVVGAYQRNGARMMTADGQPWIELAVCRPDDEANLAAVNCLLP